MRNVKTFYAGIHVPHSKQLTQDSAICVMPAPKWVAVPLSQHIGAAAELLVAVGDTVKKGQLLAKFSSMVSANVFSPVSGTVTGIKESRYITGGRGKHIIIDNDGLDTEEERFKALENPTSQEIIDRVRQAGIVGMGGAAFPTPVKLSVPEGKQCDTLLINAAECEPYITCDYRIMLEYTDEFVAGVKLIAKALNVENIVIGIESNKPRAAEKLATYDGIHIEVLEAKYPQGAEKQLIFAATGRIVPSGKLPIDVNVVVQNVHTALSVYRAVKLGIPSYERVVTVSGRGINQPKNMWVRTGVTIEDIVDFCGGMTEDIVKILSGGPMMGIGQARLTVSLTKASGAILFLTESEISEGEEMVCINCARCASVCPMRLMPMYIDAYTLLNDTDTAKKYGVENCIECGCCSYICPSKRPLIQSIRLCKKRIKEKKN